MPTGQSTWDPLLEGDESTKPEEPLALGWKDDKDEEKGEMQVTSVSMSSTSTQCLFKIWAQQELDLMMLGYVVPSETG